MHITEFAIKATPVEKIKERVKEFLSKDKYVLELRASSAPDSKAIPLPCTFADRYKAIK